MTPKDPPFAPVEDDDELVFVDDTPEGLGSGDASPDDGAQRTFRRPWRVLAVDDDAEVLAMTRMLLSDFEFNDRPLELLSATSGRDAFEIMAQEEDIAVILLDVVMETDDAGLVLVRRIREELNNKAVRIILRTGQPGLAPERDIIVDADINDYKSKTELTAQKLFTTVVVGLRAYNDIVSLSRFQSGLTAVVEAAAQSDIGFSSLMLANGLLGQINATFGATSQDCLCVARLETGKEQILVTSGRFEAMFGLDFQVLAAAPCHGAIHAAMEAGCDQFSPGMAVFIEDRDGPHGPCRLAVFLTLEDPPQSQDRSRIELFCTAIANSTWPE
ncbi:MAG: DUF3369 domain-containing protein [Rhodospirillaceae bacterium]